MDVRAITFTGSAATGRIIAATAAKSNLKHVLLELGGKCPAIIFDDADLERAAEETQYSAHWNSGQACMANSRIYVQNTIADKFIALFKEKFAKNAKPGDPTNEVTNQGPQADVLQYNHVRRLVELGKSTGRLELGGDMEEAPKNGFYVPPTIFTSTPEDAEIMKTEVFGPVVNINVFATESEVIQKANDTEYGLYASVYTKNLDRAMRFGKALEAGTIAVNATGPVFAVDMPFGGLKSSGWGRESLKNSLNNFLETKTVMFRVEEEKS
jgi:aldehyde dehydrogenase (NAD+)